MSNNTNNKTDQSETLAQLYKMFLYKKKNIIAIQKKLGINSNANQMAVYQSNKAKTFANSYDEAVVRIDEDLIPIRNDLNIDNNLILEVAF